MTTPNKTPEPPANLAQAGRAYWVAVVEQFDLEDADLPLLVGTCQMLDRAATARRQVEAEGLTTTDRFGQSKENPSAAVERQSWLTFARLRRELNVDSVPPPVESPRPLRAAFRCPDYANAPPDNGPTNSAKGSSGNCVLPAG